MKLALTDNNLTTVTFIVMFRNDKICSIKVGNSFGNKIRLKY